MPVVFGERFVPLVLFDTPKTPTYPSIVWGATCDPRDQMGNLCQMPDLKRGDWLYYETVGAYTITMSSKFNGFPAAVVHSIVKNKDW